MKSLLICILHIFIVNTCYSLNLSDFYALSLINDPEFKIALKEKDAMQANLGIGRSFLLPNIAYSYSRYKNNFDQSLVNDPSGNNSITNLDYFSSISQLTLNQTIVNFSQIANYKKGIAQAALSIETYRSKSYQLADRLMSAYFETLLTIDQSEAIKAQISAYSEQLKVNKKLFDLGLGTKTDIFETQARLEVAESTLYGYQNTLENNIRKLSSITGVPEEKLKAELGGLNKEFIYLGHKNLNTKELIDTAIDNNPDLAEAKKTIEVYSREIESKKGNFLPSLNLQASLSTTQSQYVTQYNQQYQGSSIGLILNIPIFNGGYDYYNLKQSKSNLEIAQAQFDFKKERVIQEILKEYSLLNSLNSQITSLTKAKESIEFLKESSKKSFQAGFKTNLDILNAEQQLLQNKKDLAQSKYEYLLAYLRLKIAQGNFNESHLTEIEKNVTSK